MIFNVVNKAQTAEIAQGYCLGEGMCPSPASKKVLKNDPLRCLWPGDAKDRRPPLCPLLQVNENIYPLG